MATYTDNYNLIKPTYAETADIVPLNNNFEKIDEVMHASQTSLAPAYDQTASYQPGDVVMYELNMYKCTGATSGTWDPSKWTRTTAAETGGGGSVDFDIFGEGSGSVVTITDGAEAGLAECIAEIEATQSGSGTPSPSNVRPIVGRSEVNITVSDGETDNVTTIPLDRTVYGGTLDVTRGILTDEVGDLISFTSDNVNVWSGVATSSQGVTRFYTTPSYVGRTLLQSDSYELSPNYNTQTDIITTSVDGRIIITPTFGQGKTLEEFKALLATYPFNIKMTLATPQTYTLTPEEVSTILGYNNISADSGDVSVVYVKQTAPIKPNPTGADIPLTGIGIDGEKFKIPSGANYITDVLLDETNGVTVGVTYGFLNSHTLDEYDAIEIIVATRQNVSGGLGYDHWFMTVRSLLDFPIINYGAYEQRWFNATFTNNSVIQNNSSGDQYPYIYRIYGIKY